MLTLFLFLIILVPTIAQIHYGNRSNWGYVDLKLWQISLFTIIAHILLTIALFYISSFSVEVTERQHCNMAPAGIILFSILLFVVLLVVIIIQNIIKLNKKL